MMLGIRVTTGKQTLQEATGQTPALQVSDFDSMDKLNFPPEGGISPSGATPSHRLAHTFKFKTYSPGVFKRMRRHFGINDADYMLSLAGDFNYIEFIANSKSGQFFFYSHDGRYMIKTQTHEESRFLRKLLPQYYAHITRHPNTLMTRFYGMYRVKMKFIHRKIHFVIMASVFDTPLPVHLQFDLKGSTVGRHTSAADKEAGKVQKDNDLTSSGRKLALGDHRQLFLDTIEADSRFLAENHIMDYSLLVGIHEPHSVQAPLRNQSVRLTKDYTETKSENDGRPAASSVASATAAADAEDDVTLPRQSSAVEAYDEEKEDGPAAAGAAAAAGPPASPRAVSGEAPGLASVWASSDSGGFEARGEGGRRTGEVYFMGIIDILQVYNASKRAEHFFRGLTHDRSKISAVDPRSYARRFVQFLTENTT